MINTPPSNKKFPIGCIVALFLVAFLTYGGIKAFNSLQSMKSPFGNLNTSPTSTISPDMPSKPGDALMYFERSDEKWLQDAASGYNQQNPDNSRVVLDFRGSREGKQAILYGKGHPIIWNPADTYWIDKLSIDWKNPAVGKHTDDIVGKSTTILSTRYIFVMWSDRAKVFSAAMALPKYRGKTWALLYQIATLGWSSIGGSTSWGKLKLAQSNPSLSNSGQDTLSLMYLEYRHIHPDDTPSSPGFAKFMDSIENCVPQFQETTSKSVEAMEVGGKDRYDMAIAYEANGITAIQGGNQDLQIIYPDPTEEVDFPAAILSAPWVTVDESKTANSFVEYLLSRDIQQKAVNYGFRPALDDMRSTVDTAFSSGPVGLAGFQLDPNTVTRPVSTRVVDDLIYQWYRVYGSR